MSRPIDTEREYYPQVLIDEIDKVERASQASPAGAQEPLSRRGFMKASVAAGGGFLLAFGLLQPGEAEAQQAGAGARPAGPGGTQINPGAYVKIAPGGRITLYSKNPEIGQGIKTAFGLILAEELDAKWSDVIVEQAPINAALYGTQFAGGSLSIPSAWTSLRQAGAAARAMLASAAAQQWNVPEAEVTTSDSRVIHAATGRTLGYGDVATAAAALPVPAAASLKLKDRKDWKLLGKRTTGVDNLKIVTGQPLFGVDIQLPDMKVAVFEKCPAVGGKVAAANLEEIRSLPGVTDAFIVQGTGVVAEVMPGVAIVASNTWAAFSARRKLKIEWDETSASKDSWTALTAQARAAAAKGEGAQELRRFGDVDAALRAAKKTVEAFYTFGFVSHQPLEPQNTTAWYQADPEGDRLELWAPVQIPDSARTTAARVVGVQPARATLYQLRAGGAFGRRLLHDYACEAAAISKQAGGIPVKLMWTREDDLAHDFYRAGGFHQLRAAVDAQGRMTAWSGHCISFSDANARVIPGRPPAAVTGGGWPSATEFPAEYTPNHLLTQTLLPISTPCGMWRAPGSNTAAFVVQSFLHEVAVAAGRDHAEFLIDLFGQKQPGLPPAPPAFGGGSLDSGRAINTIKAVVQRSNYGKPPRGRHHGLAFHFAHQAHIAEVAEVSVDAKKKVTVHRVWVVADIGPVVNLSGAEHQVMGCIVDAVSTMSLEVTIENGRIRERNFDTYRLKRMPAAPEVDVHFLDTDYPPSGIGEPAFPPAAPAICNAIYAATGQRIRTLPVTREGFTMA